MMRTPLTSTTICLLLTSPCWAAKWTVTTTANSGTGSLRWAIGQANSNPGSDTITFKGSLATRVLAPTTQLPALSDGGTTIDGDLDDDGTPDIQLDGRNLADGSGLRITHSEKPGCLIRGLSIIRCPDHGILIDGSMTNAVKGCYLGVNRAGAGVRRNGAQDIYVLDSYLDTIGGSAAEDRNVFATGDGTPPVGIAIDESTYTRVRGNYFGIGPDGVSKLPGAHVGVRIVDSSKVEIGGDSAGEGNVFAALIHGVFIVDNSHHNTVAGNLFGLAPDGTTAMPNGGDCVQIARGPTYNLIGGASAAARNVFVSQDSDGVYIGGVGTARNKVRGNYFGTNVAGTGKRPIRNGVFVAGDAAAQTVGGPAASHGNYFCCTKGTLPAGVALMDAGEGSLIQNNHFGVRPNGRAVSGMSQGVYVQGSYADVLDNVFANMTRSGLEGVSSTTSLRGLGNTFRACERGVYVWNPGSRVFLGNLTNAATDDDGGNVFEDSNAWFIQNSTVEPIRAEGNTFPSTSRSAINAKIIDRRDDVWRGVVDFDPLAGGVTPTGGGTVGIAGAVAVPTAGGAEIVYALSAPADVSVTVLNIAGRPVATVAANSAMEAGTQRLSWSGRSDTGTLAPAGRYLVRITARGDSGEQAHAVALLQLGR